MTRVRFARDDLLRASDLAADVEAEAARRGRHVRGAHRTWGIALGFDVMADAGGLLVGPGFAYDPCGREIVSGRTRRVRAPEGTMTSAVLVVRAAGPARPGRVAATFGWRRPGQATGEAVPLARCTLTDGTLGDPDPSVRVAARTLAGARVAAGTQDVTFEPAYLTTIQVDTSVAGFTATPIYLVTLAEPAAAGFATLGGSHFLGPFAAIRDESATGFVLDLRLAEVTRGGSDPSLRNDLSLSVEWIGAEAPSVARPRSPRSEHGQP
jgi:hypothetical protein